MLVARSQCVAQCRYFGFVSLFVLVSGSCPIFLCLGSIDHDGLPTDLLIAHCQGHQDRLWRVELNIGDSFRFTRTLVTDYANVTDLAYTCLREESVNLFFIGLQMDTGHKHGAIVTLCLFSLSLCFFKISLQSFLTLFVVLCILIVLWTGYG